MRFEHANFLWLLLVVPPALALFFRWREGSRQKLLAQFIEARLLSTLTVGISPQRRKFRFTLLVLVSALLITALARPQLGFNLEEVEEHGLDIVVAVDTSKSMLAQDIAPNRLERAKLAALELMQDAASDRLGLVAFAGQAFLECPLTVDDTAFEESVQALDVNSVSQGGTGIANAINTALTAFKEGGHYRTLVLITDGEDNVNEAAALEAAKDAGKAGMKIFTIGVGTPEGALIGITGPDGNSDYVRDADGNVVKTHLNENLLRQIATLSGGFYLPLRGADTMDVLYERGLAPLPKSQGVGRMIRHYHEQYQWPLAMAMLLLLIEMLLPERKKTKGKTPDHQEKSYAFRSSAEPEETTDVPPLQAPPVINAPPIINSVLLLALLLLPLATQASPSSALRDYNAGNYTNALDEYSTLAETQTNDLRLIFNAGDAAYRATNFDLAQNLFQQATLSPDAKLQQKAYYNLGNAQFRLGQAGFGQQDVDLNDIQNQWEEAAKSYQHAYSLDTNDADAAFNFNFAKNCVAQIIELREMALRAKAAADEATRRRNYDRALAIMQEQLQKNPTAKQFKDYVKKLKDIDDIANNRQPQPQP
jgi:Ca-activated chloride channel family protein